MFYLEYNFYIPWHGQNLKCIFLIRRNKICKDVNTEGSYFEHLCNTPAFVWRRRVQFILVRSLFMHSGP